MTMYMHLPAAAARGEQAGAISPELVLVDPVLASTERARLPLPSERRFVPSPPSLAPRPPATYRVDAPARSASRRVLVGVAATTMLVLLLFDVRVQVGERPASAEREPIETAPVVPSRAKPRVTPKPMPTVRPPASPRPSKAERRFAWAPVAGATGYHVEFFRGPRRVLSRNTTRPEFVVPASWVFEGVERSLRPGEYRWYVWPIVSGLRQSQAAVQTTVTISPG